MKTFIISILGLIVLIFIGIQLFFSSASQPTLASKSVNAFLTQMSKKLSKQYKMETIGRGANMLGGELERLSLEFYIYRPLTKDDVRKILVGCVEEFLEAANTDKKLRPLMKFYPFTPENIEIVVFIYPSKKLENIYHPDIGFAAARDNNITYKTYDPEAKLEYKSETTESFAEASQIVKGY